MQNSTSFEKMEFSKTFLIVSLIVLCLLGLFLRVWNLENTSLWVDEVIYAHTAQSWLESGEMKVPSGHLYTRAPLYTIFTGFIYNFFGQGDAETRFVSVFFGMLSLGMTYLLAQKIFDKKTALLALFLMTFSHFEIGWSRTARMYTMLQFLTLCTAYCMICFLEPKSRNPVLTQKWFHKLKVDPISLLPLIFLLATGYLYVHTLTAFLAVTFFLYLFFMSVIQCIVHKDRKKWWNKYFILTLLYFFVFLTGIVFYPKSLDMIREFLSYTPPWASGDVSALNRTILFEFLISPYRFPLAFLFLVGAIQVFTRWRPRAILVLMLFIGQILFLSFVFTHRKPVYLFNVYPIFLMIAGFGFLNIVSTEMKIVKENIQNWIGMTPHLENITRFLIIMVIIIAFSVFVLSPWFRISLHIPFQEDGISNMAVTSAEWKEVAKMMKQKANPEDVVLSSHPELSLYYQIDTDYTLNWTLLNQAKSLNLIRDGYYFDNYSGVPCIENLEQLELIVAAHARIWLLIDSYAFRKSAYLPEAIRDFINKNFEGPVYTRNKTIIVFHRIKGLNL